MEEGDKEEEEEEEEEKEMGAKVVLLLVALVCGSKESMNKPMPACEYFAAARPRWLRGDATPKE